MVLSAQEIFVSITAKRILLTVESGCLESPLICLILSNCMTSSIGPKTRSSPRPCQPSTSQILEEACGDSSIKKQNNIYSILIHHHMWMTCLFFRLKRGISLVCKLLYFYTLLKLFHTIIS